VRYCVRRCLHAKMNNIKLQNISKKFDQPEGTLLILDNLSLKVKQGEFLSIIGPSGCGKSTLLHMIAGLEKASSGRVIKEGKEISSRLGGIGYVQQKDVLLPWRSVLDNVILGLELQGVPRQAAKEKALKHMSTFGLSGFENSYPKVLSRGMRQRASLLRSVLLNQNILLLDEPFGALDAMTRSELHTWLLNLWKQLKSTVLLVTHDIDEALALSDRIVILSQRQAKIKTVINIENPRQFEPQKISELKSTIYAILHDDKNFSKK
jgi:ABC-type nitrate/sulfonate/bicarbonate transport system ATPase subunit